jgi:uncharacterized membrane protein
VTIGVTTLFGDVPAMIRLLGRCHTAVVHFPIALVTVAAALESWQLLRGRRELARATPVCLAIGAFGAVLASLFGLFLDESEGGGGDPVVIHKWAGLVATAAAIVALALLRMPISRRAVLRLTIVAAAGLTSMTGYLGGELVFGHNHLFKGVFDEAGPEMPGLAAVANSTQAQLTQSSVEDTIDFTNDVLPLLRQNCLRCHGGDKVKASSV